MAISEATIANNFRIIEIVAAAGVRCPFNRVSGGDIDPVALKILALRGAIRINIFPHNFRQVEILEGPMAGKATAAPPKRCRPYKWIDKTGVHFDVRRPSVQQTQDNRVQS